MAAEALPATKLAYFDDMWAVEAAAVLLAQLQTEDGRIALILDSTIFYPQGGGQPADTGFISGPASGVKFVVEDVRLKDGLVYHYGFLEGPQSDCAVVPKLGDELNLHVDPQRRDLNSRLHSAGHLLDVCMHKVGLSHLEPGKCYHFPDSPFVEYKGLIPQDLLQVKQKELETETNALILTGGKISASILSYDEASNCCGGVLPSYIAKDSSPRIVKLGDHPGCPCGGTHVEDIANIRSMKITQIRTKKGSTRVSYSIGA
ncbi:alanine--tRNA ligase-like [Zingiber officinale]|uniref:Alanyl-transfer RNA synthetases family profile domain-containing protein n=1 Tax=Zingiber officinale TaxID=94328 RepID=A0A8J5FWW9_ZINOF|nr:alanine--tRNA ligase-like [Zingiber officinale]KAG6496425.1 hypothetical protein ZIOFF_044292 [Zingiber officinale]